MSVSPLDLLAASTYSRRDSRTLADVLKGGQDQAIDAATANAKNQAQDIANKRSQLGLEEDESLHPLVMAQLAREAQGGQPSQGPALPPPYQGVGPQPDKPFMLGQGAPSSMTGQPSAVPDPYAQQQALLGEQGQLAQFGQGHPVLMALSPKLKAIQDAKEANLKDRQGVAGSQFTIDQNRAFASLIPDMEAVKTKGLAAMKGASPRASIDAYNAMVGNVQSAVASKRPDLLGSKVYQDYMKDLEKYKPTPQPNMTAMLMTPPPPSLLDDAAKRIANHESTVSEEINKGRFTGSMAMQVHNDLLNRVRALDPNFSEAESEAGYAFAKNPATRRAISQLDNAYSTLDRLKGVYAKLDNTQFPTLNKAFNAGAIQKGDVDAARASIAEVLGNDELTQAFSRGGMGSDKLREMSSKLANYNMSPQQMAAQFDEIMHGLERSRNAYVGQGGGYIKPLKTAESAPKISSQAEFDALPAGAEYISAKTGKRGRKP